MGPAGESKDEHIEHEVEEVGGAMGSAAGAKGVAAGAMGPAVGTMGPVESPRDCPRTTLCKSHTEWRGAAPAS